LLDTDNNDSSWSGNPDGDIDVKMSSSSSNHPIEFSINIPINPEGQSATLVLDVLDVDVDCKSYVSAGVKCEVDEVYVNDTKIGVLNGKNDEWARNRLSIPEDVLASKKQINQLISWNWKLDADERKAASKPDLFNSWRYEYVKEVLKEWQN